MAKDPETLREAVLRAVDALKARAIQPDDVSIPQFVRSSYLESPSCPTTESIISQLSASIMQRDLIRLKLTDGSFEYRRASSVWETKDPVVSESLLEKSEQILSTVEKLCNSSGSSQGVTAQQVTQALHSSFLLLDCDKQSIQTLLEKETNLGTCVQLGNGNFGLCPPVNGSQASESRKRQVQKSPESEKSVSSVSSRSYEVRAEDSGVMTRGRPVSTRKKIKKSLGPDFLDPSDLGYSKPGYGYMKTAYETSKCTFCQDSSSSRKELVNCLKCDCSGHSKCIKQLHPHASTLHNSKWLCPNCAPKCLTCKKGYTDPKNPVFTCTDCDSVYHVNCLEPENATRAVNWKCKECLEEPELSSQTNGQVQMVTVEPLDDNEDSLPKPDFFNGLLRKELESAVLPSATVSSTNPTNGSVTSEASLDSRNSVVEAAKSEKKRSPCLPPPLVPPLTNKFADPKNWAVDDVCKFINSFGYETEATIFKDQEIDGKSLLLLRRDDVLTGLGLKLGPAVKIYALITHLQRSVIPSPDN